MRRQIRLVQYGLIATGVLVLGYCLTVYLDEWRFQVVENRLLSGNPRQYAATPKVSLQHGAVLGRLEIPGVGVSVMVVEGGEDGTLRGPPATSVGQHFRVRREILELQRTAILFSGRCGAFNRAIC